MLQMMMGAKVYETNDFKQAMDSHYYPLANMKQSVAKLASSENIDIETMEFGPADPGASGNQPKWPQNLAEECRLCPCPVDRSAQ